MPAPAKPSVYLDWVTSGSAPNVTQPPSSLQTTGWTPAEKPPPDFMNWLFYITDQWIKWMDYEIEHVINVASGVSADSVVLTTTGDISNGSDQLSNLASTTGILEGQLITGAGIPANTYVLSLVGSVVTMSKNATSSLTTNSVAFSHNFASGSDVQSQLDELDSIVSSVVFLERPIAATVNVLSTTGNTTLNSATIASLASTTNIQEGQLVTGTGIPSGTYVRRISGSTVILSKLATASGVGVALVFKHSLATDANVQRQLDQLDAGIKAQTGVGSGLTQAISGTAYNITAGDAGKQLLLSLSAACALQLPDPSTMIGKPFTIIDVTGAFATYNASLVPFGSEKIVNLAANYVMESDYFFGTFNTDGTDWFRIS